MISTKNSPRKNTRIIINGTIANLFQGSWNFETQARRDLLYGPAIRRLYPDYGCALAGDCVTLSFYSHLYVAAPVLGALLPAVKSSARRGKIGEALTTAFSGWCSPGPLAGAAFPIWGTVCGPVFKPLQARDIVDVKMAVACSVHCCSLPVLFSAVLDPISRCRHGIAKAIS